MDIGKIQVRVFKNAKEKINRYNSYDTQCNARRYNSAYHKILAARGTESSLVNHDGIVEDSRLRIVEDGLIAFDMGRQMNNQFGDRLKNKLGSPNTKAILKKFRRFAIVSSDIREIESDTKTFFTTLYEKNDSGLSSRDDHFGVGATKIMNYLFPELFVMADQWVMKGLHKTGTINPQKYWNIMMVCHQALGEWQETHGNLTSLTELEEQPTTHTRIFDKCAFVMGKFGS